MFKAGKTPQGRTRVLAVSNQKGGVGKTTTAINLGTALAAIGEKVLIVDMDPQGNASTGLGVPRETRRVTIYDVMVDGRSVDESAVPTTVPGLDIVPADADMSGVEIELSQADRRSYRLRDALRAQGSEGQTRYDYVLIDCPPSLNLLTLNAMAAADAVLVPLQCEFFALEGLTQLMKTIEMVRQSLNPTLEIQGLVLTMYDRRSTLSGQVAADVRNHFGDKVYEAVIPRNVRVAEAPSFGKPALIYDLKCAGSQAYLRLAREVVAREKSRRLQAA
ncbi:MAG: ParA family protein [Alphaproteobacteria bacterium]|nr:ParA family protein [Alphaproteobacteria bacterium]MBU2042304.1 ParA family protein [Alphaproteobacteria bacterium]MBU2126363.1 ParA family protein [Alphaproteobacteria bacterium]MBU2209810.1 ParA family protein [Alphaproteobacteria bacterium]MBU2290715.1 ParA family protein [Alphaproteobacteria bacterium]